MANNSACFTVLVLLVLGLTSAQLKWNKVTLSQEPNEDWIYYHRSLFAYIVPKGETFQPAMNFIYGKEARGLGMKALIGDGPHPSEDDMSDALKTPLHFQGNLLLYTRNGTFLGGTNLFHQSAAELSLSELTFGIEDEVEFFMDIPTCGIQKFTKSKDGIPEIHALMNYPGRGNAIRTTWNMINHADPECPEVFGAFQFVTSRDQFDLEQYYSTYYRVENWKGGDVMYPYDDHNDFIAEDVIAITDDEAAEQNAYSKNFVLSFENFD